MANFGSKALVTIVGAATAITGAALWNNEFGEAESLRGRDPGISIEKVAHAGGDMFDWVDQRVGGTPSRQELEDWQIPMNYSVDYLALLVGGAAAIGIARKRL